MRHLLTVFVMLCIAALPLRAEDARSGAVVGVIQSQLDAFQQDDFAKAFTHASPTIKQLFGNPTNFERMVKNGFPMVWRPSEVQFLDFEDKAGQVSQNVLFRDAKGVPVVLQYIMLKTETGWQIDGVVPVQAPDVAA